MSGCSRSVSIELPASLPRQFVELRSPILFGPAPLALQESVPLEAMQRRIQGTLFHAQHPLRLFFDTPTDGESVQRSRPERLEHQQIHRAVQGVRFDPHAQLLSREQFLPKLIIVLMLFTQ